MLGFVPMQTRMHARAPPHARARREMHPLLGPALLM